MCGTLSKGRQMRRFSPRTVLVIGFASAALLLTGCGTKKATDTTVAAETTVAAADTTPASVDTTAAAATDTTTAAAETVAGEPVVTEAATTDAMAGETTAAAGADPATASALNDTIISQMVIGMTGEATADPADVKCISGKVPEKDIAAIMGSAGGGGSPDPAAMKSLIKAVFTCKPKGLAESFVKSTFTDIPGDVTDKQKSCLANGLFDLIGKDDSVVDAITANADKMPENLKKAFEGKVKDCVPAGVSRDALIKEIDK
jgi:hypothetical protein